MGCHGNAGSAELKFPPLDSDDHAWTGGDPAVVIAGDIRESQLVASLKQSVDPGGFRFDWGTDSARTMPQAGAPLSGAEIQALVAWVEGISEESGGGNDGGGGNDPVIDPIVVPGIPVDPTRVTRNTNERFLYAISVISTKCMSCHATRTDLPRGAQMLSEDAWRSSGVIVPGNALASKLVQRLQAPSDAAGIAVGNALKVLNGSMPLNAPALNTADIATIADWIDMMNLPTAQLMIVPQGTNRNSWNTADKPVRGKVSDVLRVRNLDSTTHSIHAGGRPFGHGISNGGDPRVNFGGAQDFVFIAPADNVLGGDSIYDHFKSSGGGNRIYFLIAP